MLKYMHQQSTKRVHINCVTKKYIEPPAKSRHFNEVFVSTTDLRARFGARNHRKSGKFIDQYKSKMKNLFREMLTQYLKRPVIRTKVSREEVNVFYVTLMALARANILNAIAISHY